MQLSLRGSSRNTPPRTLRIGKPWNTWDMHRQFIQRLGPWDLPGAFSCAHSVRFVPRFSPRAASETESWKSWSRAKNFPVFRGSKSRPIPPKVSCVASYAEIYTLCKNLHPPTFALEGKKPPHPRSCWVHGQERVSMSCRCVSTLCLGSDSPICGFYGMRM